VIRSMLGMALCALALSATTAFAESQPLSFSGDYEAVDLGFDSKWWPGSTDAPDSGNPIQVRVAATGVASADADFLGSIDLTGDTLKLGTAAGEWGYDFGAAITMEVAINLSFNLNNPLPFGDDINIGPWVLDIPYAPDFDLVTSKRAQVSSFLLDEGSNLADSTEGISVYDLSIVEFLIGDIDLPDWALAILGLDAGASLNVSFTTDATLTGEKIALSDGTEFTSEGQSNSVAATPPNYSATGTYEENLDWDLILNFSPAVFIDILGQRYELPIITIPWQVLSDRRDMNFNQASISLPVAVVEEGEGVVEGIAEGEGVVEEGEEEPIVFFSGCATECVSTCESDGSNAGIADAFAAAYAAAPIGATLSSADLDGNGINDIAQASLLDSLLASPELPNHCCVLAAWNANYLAVESMAGFGGDRLITDSQAAQLRVLAAFATFGEAEGYAYISSLATLLEWTIDLHSLDTSAGAYASAQGDADLDQVCNLGEYESGSGDPVSFIISATDPQLAEASASCTECGFVEEGALEGIEEGEAPVRWTLTIVEEGTGTGDVVIAPDEADFADGQTVTLSVFLGTNSTFFGWNGVTGVQFPSENGNEVLPIVGTNKFTILMNGNKVIRPHFFLYAPIEGEDEGEGSVGEGEGTVEGESTPASADVNADGIIALRELLRLIQLYNAGAFYCDPGSEDGVGLFPLTEGEASARDCAFHTSDYNPADWRIGLTELLRLVQFYSVGGYVACDSSEDGFCVVSR
jgi:hypothetical protein